MSTTIDTFIYLQRDIEQSFQRVQTISQLSHYDQHELDQLLNHISCTLDDLQKVNQLLRSTSSTTSENQSVNNPLFNLSENENDFSDGQKRLTVNYTKENEEVFLSSNSNSSLSFEEREDFIRQMKADYSYYKNKIPSIKKESQMETIRLDQHQDDENFNEDQLIRKQDEQLDDMHHSIISLKNLTKNINFELEDHIRVLDNLDNDMISSQNRVENLTKRTKDLFRTSAGGVGGHTCLFSIAVGLFFLIIILILFF
ncbi:hypothetical protein I4U23_028531 [Adineta vaga]|nr:hypothetical protein I4U23_028531 [Adineta vaga]